MQTIIRIDGKGTDARFYRGLNEDAEALWTYPSVTSKLKEVYPSGYYLEKYIRDNGEHGRVEFVKAGDDGTEAHIVIERLNKGEELPTLDMNDKVKRCVQAYIDWHHEFKPEVLETEQIVVNHDYKYAGALDLYCELDYQKGKTHYKGKYVVDFKTSKSVHPQHKVQVAAYAKAHDPSAKVAILHLGNTTKAKYSFLEYDIKPYWDQFKKLNELYDMMKPDAQPNVTEYPEVFTLKQSILKTNQ